MLCEFILLSSYMCILKCNNYILTRNEFHDILDLKKKILHTNFSLLSFEKKNHRQIFLSGREYVMSFI